MPRLLCAHLTATAAAATLALTSSTAAPAATSKPTTGPELKTGVAFPLIPLPFADRSEDRGLHTLKDFRGKKTVVHIFAGW